MHLHSASAHGLTLGLEFEQVLRRQGIHDALQLLNATTPYRLTGVYRFDGDVVVSVVLFDRKNPRLDIGINVPWNDSYCRMAAEDGRQCEIVDALQDRRLTMHAAREAVRAYVAVLLKTPDGAPLGTLCHYDLHPVTPPLGVFEDLDAVCPTVERTLWGMLKLTRMPGRVRAVKAQLDLPSRERTLHGRRRPV